MITFLRRERPAGKPTDDARARRPRPAAGESGFCDGLLEPGPVAEARDGSPRAAYGPLTAWAALIAIAFGAGAALRAAGMLPVDALPPLHAHARLLTTPLIPAATLALAGVIALPIAARRLPWPLLLGISWPASAAWAVALQLPDGLSRPLTNRADYLAGLPAMGDDPLGWLRGFTTHLWKYPTHVKGHPPLPMLILWILRWTGLAGAGWATALVIAVGASSTAAIAMTVRAVASEPLARRALPFLILAPTAIWVATSMDALFLGAAAWGTALLTRATIPGGGGGPRPPWGAIPLLSSRAVDRVDKGFHRLWITLALGRPESPKKRANVGTPAATNDLNTPGDRSAAPANSAARPPAPLAGLSITQAGLSTAPAGPPTRPAGLPTPPAATPAPKLNALAGAFAGGLLVGSLPYLSYGLVTILALPLAVLILTRPPRTLVLAFGLGCLVIPVAFTLEGFAWWDGVIQTHAAWAAGSGAQRPYAYFLIGDLAVLALLVGPAAAQALLHLLRRPASNQKPRDTTGLGILLAAALIGVLALDISGVTRGEVERIWLPYAAWMTAGAAIHRAPARRMLLAQVVTALLIQALVKSPW